jgi:phospholipase/carboxylesterase
MNNDPHRNTPVLQLGASLTTADGVVIFLHGRGSSAEDILGLAHEMYLPQLAYIAPQASGHSWYPQSFLAPSEQNQPWLSSALKKVLSVVQMAHDAGISTDRIAVAGFSQGACLSTEFVASYPERYAGLIAFTGGLIGPLGTDLSHAGNLEGTPAFLGSGDPDPHVPWERVQQSADILANMGAKVIARRFEGRGHTVSREELDSGTALLRAAFDKPVRKVLPAR